MIGVGENNFGIEFPGQIPLHDPFDGRLGADRHEYGGLDNSVVGVKQTGARARLGTNGLNFEVHYYQCTWWRRA